MALASQLTGSLWPAILLGTLAVASPGLCTVASTLGLKVGEAVQFSNGALSHSFVVKAVLSDTTFLVYNPHQPTGTIGVPGQTITDPIAYNGGQAYVPQQERASQGNIPVIRSVYEESPITALRTILVDGYGNYITPDNPLPVNLEVDIGPVTVQLSAFTVPPDSVMIVGTEDGTVTGIPKVVKVNPDGSLAVELVVPPSTGMSYFYQITNVAVNATMVIATYITPPGPGQTLNIIEMSGENIALYDIAINGTPFARRRTYFGNMNAVVNCGSTGSSTGC